MRFLVYSVDTGEIKRLVSAGTTEGALIQVQSGEDVIPGTANDAAECIDLSTLNVVPRVDIPYSALGTTLSGLPNPTKIRVFDDYFTVTDGVADFNFAEPGDYTVIMRSPPYLDTEATIHVD